MNIDLISIIDIDSELDINNKFTLSQLKSLIDLAFQYDNKFNEHVSEFYINIRKLEYDSVEDLIYDIQNGNEDALNTLANDIYWYFK